MSGLEVIILEVIELLLYNAFDLAKIGLLFLIYRRMGKWLRLV